MVVALYATNVWPKKYGADEQAKRESNQGCEKARKRYRFAGISDRSFYGKDQEAHRPPQEKRQRFPFPPRPPQDGI